MSLNFLSEHIFSFNIAFIPALINLAVALYVLVKMPRNGVIDTFVIFLLSLVCWQLGDAGLRVVNSAQQAFKVNEIFASGWILFGPLGLHFAIRYASKDNEKTSNLLLFLLYAPALLFIALFEYETGIKDIQNLGFWGWYMIIEHNIFLELLFTWLGLLAFISLCFYIKAFLNAPKKSNRYYQAMLIMIGYLIPTVQGIFTEIILPVYFNSAPIPITSTTMGMFSLMSLIALRRYRLFNLEQSVSTSRLVNRLEDIVIIIDFENKIMYINEQGLVQLGYSPNELDGKHINNILTKKTDTDKPLFTDADSYNNVGLLKKNGDVFPVSIKSDLIKSGSKSEGYLLIATNVNAFSQSYEVVENKDLWFQTLINSSNDAIIFLKPNGRIFYASPSCANVFGYLPEDLIKFPLSDIMYFEDIAPFKMFRQQMEGITGMAGNISIRFRHKSGKWVWTDGKCVNMLADSTVSALVFTFTDITEKHEAELEKEKNLALFQSLIKSSMSGFILEDEEHTILQVNEAFCNIFESKLSPDEMKGLNFLTNIAGIQDLFTDPDLFMTRMASIYEDREPVTSEEIKLKSGQVYERDYVPIYTSKGDFIGQLWNYRDVTDKVKYTEQIHWQRELLQQLFDASPMAIMMVGVSGKVLNANNAFEKMYLYTKDEIIGQNPQELIVPPELKEKSTSIWNRSVDSNKIMEESHRVRKDGSLIDVVITPYPIVIDDKLQGMYIIYNDITDRKAWEARLLDQNLELEKINNELDKFVYSVSHDIRSPLMSIMGIINMAEMDGEEVDWRVYLDMIKRNIQRLDDFTSNVIVYSRNARGELLAEEINFDVLLHEIVDALRYQIIARNIEFIIEVSGESAFYTDKGRLLIVLNNIISNAIKYQRESAEEPFIYISVHKDLEEVQIKIEDCGEGIADEKLDQIFNMFSRLNVRSSGSGLGLYIVKEAINKLDGAISVSSELGRGSIFTVTLPNKRPDPDFFN